MYKRVNTLGGILIFFRCGTRKNAYKLEQIWLKNVKELQTLDLPDNISGISKYFRYREGIEWRLK